MDDARLYTVRVWRHAGRWRAAVRAVGDDQARLFTEAAPMAAWLLEGEGGPAGGPTCSAEHPETPMNRPPPAPRA